MKKNILTLISFIIILMFMIPKTSAEAATNDSSPSSNLKIGAWVGTQPSTTELNNFQILQKRKLDIVNIYVSWANNFNYVKPYADAVYSNNSTLMMTWDAWGYTTVDIANGSADNYIKNMADNIKSYGKEIWINPLHEANGNWFPWGLGDSKVNTNDTYKSAYRHIVDIFRKEGTVNVKWIFNINVSNVGTGTSFIGHYPGDEYVDYTSLDGYNWGTSQSWGSTWQSFDEVFRPSYNAITTINKPVFIGEISSAEQGGDKGKWITETFNTIKTSYSKVFAVIWFSENKPAEADWRINSSDDALTAYINAINSSPVLKGDINGDNRINVLDYLLLSRYLLNNSIKINTAAADINNDGLIQENDKILLRQILICRK
ncbi:MAG: glycosyl hydrolase [Bacillota bacterium]|nr:glycosyl hydrolase [Bacillota bacterium]